MKAERESPAEAKEARVASPARLGVAAVLLGVWAKWLAASPGVAIVVAVALLALLLVVVASIPGATINLGSLLTAPAREPVPEGMVVDPLGRHEPRPMTHEERTQARLRRGCLWGAVVFGVVLVTMPGLFLVLGWQLSDWFDGPNSEARRREDLLLALPTGDLEQAGMTLVDEWSSAGAEASGFMADNPDPVAVVRDYRYAEGALAACQTATDHLLAAGWEAGPRFPCEAQPYTANAEATMHYHCTGFTVTAAISADDQTASGQRNQLRLRMSTGYPQVPAPSPYELPPSGYRGETPPTTRPASCP